jgi:hypothetical protein
MTGSRAMSGDLIVYKPFDQRLTPKATLIGRCAKKSAKEF